MAPATVLRDPRLGEEIHRRVFPSGLTAYVVRKPQFSRSYATLATRFGSIDTRLGRARLPSPRRATSSGPPPSTPRTSARSSTPSSTST
jgi:hypothetical protein